MADNLSVRKLPFSLEAEQSVLGSILIDPETINIIAGILKSDDFHVENHREIYLAMQDLYLQNRSIDVVTLIDALVKRGVLERSGCEEYVKLLAGVVPSAANAADYARIVKDNSLLRQLIEASDEISESAYAAQDDVVHIIGSAEQPV